MQALTGIWKLKNWTDLSKKKRIIASIRVRMWPVNPKTKEFTQTTPAENEKKNYVRSLFFFTVCLKPTLEPVKIRVRQAKPTG